MSDCCKGMSACQHTEELKLAASNFGLDLGWIADILSRFGGKALAIVVEALRGGFTKELVVELLEKLGPEALELLVEWLSQYRMMKPQNLALQGEVTTGVVTGEEVPVIQGAILQILVEKYLPQIIEKLGPMIIEKYLPQLLEKFGPQLIQKLLDLFLKGVAASNPDVVK